MSSSDGGLSNEDTLPDDGESRTPAPRLSLPGYQVSETIGIGGMGEVLLARDPKIGRDVAIKRVRGGEPSSDLVERFMREAKIQARLDHPAIVPVYELGNDAAGQPYFTMKRLAGKTLLSHLAANDESQQRTLRAFVDVCLAIDFAHDRGVVHRDLKPANIMLGDYGEVYVLDWGVARLISAGAAEAVGTPSLSPDGQHTQAGAMLGTPGYMAPEQARGEDVGFAADVYALGCILFEILAGEPLHARSDALASTLSTPAVAPSRRRPDRAIPPELDAACEAALVADSARRPTARQLGDRVQAYLDGDRDQERRSRLAAELVGSARDAARTDDGRADAIRLAGRALALDPDSPEAGSLVMSLMLVPPKQLPQSLSRHLGAIDTGAAVQAARQASTMMLASFGLLPIAVWAGVTNWPLLVAICVLIALHSIEGFRQVRSGRINMVVPVLLGSVLLFLLSRLMGSMVLAPTLAALFVVAVGSQPQMIGRPWLVLGIGLAGFLLPMVLELTGVFARTWEVVDGRLVVASRLVQLSGTPAYVFLVAANLLFIVAMFAFVRSLTLSRLQARNQLEVHAWHLRQLLPAPPPSAELEALVAADCR